MRIIDADALLGNYKGNILTAQTDYAQGARDIIDDIRNAPAVDAVPAGHGKWIETHEVFGYLTYPEYGKGTKKHGIFDYITCSECGMKWCIEDNDTETFKYCPNCGAKMDEEKTDDSN